MENPMNWTYRASELIQTSAAPSSLRVRALWKNMRMNSLNSSPERLTMLKTNFVVSEQICVTMPCTYRMMSSEPLERPRLRLDGSPPGGEVGGNAFYIMFLRK